MRKITVDFSLQTYPLFAGYVGEHNATELTAVKPADLEGVTYSLAFMTNGEVIHSEFFGVDEEIKVTLWQQLTQDNCLFVQLEAYDENGKYLGKSTMVKLVLSNSVHGIDMIADAENPDVYAEIAQNSAFRETLEDNVDTLDKLTTSPTGKLLFDGKLIEGTGGGSSEGGEISSDLVEQIEANTENRHWHDNKAVLDAINGAMGTEAILNLFREGTEPDRGSYVGGLALKRFLQMLEIYYVTEEELAERIANGEIGGNGADGFSPIVDVAEITGGHRVTITDADGTESFDIFNGKDYVLTDADKETIVEAVLNALPVAEGVGF